MITSYEERGIQEGIRETVLRQARLRFGDLPTDFVEQVQSQTDIGALEILSDRLLTAESLGQLRSGWPEQDR
ncbi:MAG: DUF4351 domain-containing protein [Cytophagales bacterium]|nr:DUF4351 domain-containing protein [Armatimonadota bacterium]